MSPEERKALGWARFIAASILAAGPTFAFAQGYYTVTFFCVTGMVLQFFMEIKDMLREGRP